MSEFDESVHGIARTIEFEGDSGNGGTRWLLVLQFVTQRLHRGLCERQGRRRHILSRKPLEVLEQSLDGRRVLGSSACHIISLGGEQSCPQVIGLLSIQAAFHVL